MTQASFTIFGGSKAKPLEHRNGYLGVKRRISVGGFGNGCSLEKLLFQFEFGHPSGKTELPSNVHCLQAVLLWCWHENAHFSDGKAV